MINFGLLGYGYWGPILASCFAEAGYPLKAIADRNPDKLSKAKERFPSLTLYTELDSLLADSSIDAVILALPTALHYEYGKKALEAGKHILVEKPLASSLAESEALTRLAAEKGLILMVDHHFIYKDCLAVAKETLPTLGRLQYYDSVRVNHGIFRSDVDVVWDLAPHDLSILKYLLEKDPLSVSATGFAYPQNRNNSSAAITLFYQDGLTAHIRVSWLSPQKIRTVYIGGERGVLLFDDNQKENKLTLCPVAYPEAKGKTLCQKGEWTTLAPDRSNALAKVAKAFAESIESGETPLSDGGFACDVVRVLEAIEASIAQKGANVTL